MDNSLNGELILKYLSETFKIPKPKDFNELFTKFIELFKINELDQNNFRMTYIDEEKEEILILSDDDYKNYLNQLEDNNNIKNIITGRIEKLNNTKYIKDSPKGNNEKEPFDISNDKYFCESQYNNSVNSNEQQNSNNELKSKMENINNNIEKVKLKSEMNILKEKKEEKEKQNIKLLNNENGELKENQKNNINQKSKCNCFFIGTIIIIISLNVLIIALQPKYQNLIIAIYKDIRDYFFNIKASQTIIGIDFGSTYSGYAIIKEGEKLNDIKLNEKIVKLIPSELIADGSEPYSPLRIGHKAHNYNKTDLKIEKKLYFSKFKINLDPNVNINIISADIPRNQSLKLDTVIEGYLTLFRKEIFDDNRELKNNNNIKWILTVPPLWDDKSKKDMKEFAFQAGITNPEIVLEPEAASLAIFYDEGINREKYHLTKGNSFILVDAGGYTVDISANKILDNNGNLEQIILPKSYVYGSTLINNKIMEIISEVYGEGTIQQIRENNYEKWQRLLDSIEEKKIQIGKLEIFSESFKLPIEFIKGKCGEKWIGKDLCEKVVNNTKISYTSKEINIPSKFIINIINEISEKIIGKLSDSFAKTNELIKTIIITGGFSECKILRQKIEERFEGPKKLLFLNDPQTSVAKGSAIFGMKPNQILRRKCPITIGVESYYSIGKGINEEECINKLTFDNGSSFCKKNITFIKIEESVETDFIKKEEIMPMSNEIKIFYIKSDDEFSNKGKILTTINIPNYDINLSNRIFSISMKFSNYINITVIDKNTNEPSYSEIVFYP